MKPLHPLPKDVWPDMPREIAPSHIALGAVMTFYTQATGNILPAEGTTEDLANRINKTPLHIRGVLTGLYNLFKALFTEDERTKQPHEDPLCGEESEHVPKGLHDQDLSEIVGTSIIAYMVRHNPKEARKSYNLWIKHQLGLGGEWEDADLPTDIQEAIQHIQGASKFYDRVTNKDPHALAIMSNLYCTENDHGIEQDKGKCFHWALKAAKAGHPAMQLVTAVSYAAEEGVQQDLIEAYAWNSIARGSGLPKNLREEGQELLTKLRNRLTPQQRTKAEHRATQLRKQIGN